jgi:hypothetical protein
VIHQLDALIARLSNGLSRLRWVLLSRNGIGGVLIIAALGGILGIGVLHRESTDTAGEVRAASVLLRSDFIHGVAQLDDTWLRTYEGTDASGLTGRITKAVSVGTCWGFDVRISSTWLTSGVGEVDIGDVRQYPQPACKANTGPDPQ